MASRRWFEQQVEAFTKAVGGTAKIKSDGSLAHSATVSYKGEEPALNTAENGARSLNLRIERTEEGDVLSPK